MPHISQTKRKELRDYFDISNISISKKKNGFNNVSDYYDFLQKKYNLETQIPENILSLKKSHELKKQPEKTKTIIFSFDDFKTAKPFYALGAFKSIGLITDEKIREKNMMNCLIKRQ